MSALYRHAPGTIWRRALRRAERRAAVVIAARHVIAHTGIDPYTAGALVALTHEDLLHREAARLANRLAYCAGIVDPYAA